MVPLPGCIRQASVGDEAEKEGCHFAAEVGGSAKLDDLASGSAKDQTVSVCVTMLSPSENKAAEASLQV
jgi:hypothetical protein